MFRTVFRIICLGACACLFAFAFNVFLLPHHLLSGGVAGIAALIHHFVDVNSGIILFTMNIPLFILGLIYLGKKFVLHTIYTVTVLSLALKFIPIYAISEDIFLSSVIGGALYGLAVGIIIRLGSSTGGTDIISLTVSKRTNMQVGFLNICMNLFVVFSSGFVFGWDITLYTIIAIYVAGRAVDMVYTNQNKLTLTIVTDKAEQLTEELLKLHPRGITISEAEGAYTHRPRKILTTVITKFELNETKHKIKEIDANAFVNITQTLEVLGRFRRD
ncbi:YitT family protein [Bacillus tuaregi]|uniref:YitT family protein n=1 Tax=Bacillus tuaregi TaxID=1816695 RepID=UPI0008F7EA1D|nr:YitT family protein [Bacillus tuaregi]